jgi:hypothetical protein
MKPIWFIAFSIWAGCQSPQPKSAKRPKNPTVQAPETTQSTPPAAQKSISPAQYVQQLGKGLDVDWLKTGKGMANYSAQAVKDFKKMGLGHVRIRIQDDASTELFEQLKTILNDCLRENLIPIVAYQGDDFKKDPSGENSETVVQWWTAASTALEGYDARVSFDLLIEVTDALSKYPEKLNDLYEKTVSKVRETHPNRLIFISPRVRSSPYYLHELKIPSQHNGFILAEWHFYASGPSKTKATKLWTTGSAAEQQIIQQKIQKALDWQQKTGLYSWVGAWMAGDYNEGNHYTVPEQVQFATFVTCALDKAKIPHAVNSDTKFYDREQNQWVAEMQPVLNAILKPSCP